MESIWRESCKIPARQKLTQNLDTEVAVIGAGLSGLLTAFLLQEQGLHVTVLEAGRIASGQTQNTTAKITAQHNLIYDTLLRDFGKNTAKQYAEANQTAIAAYQRIIDRLHIDCDFEIKKAYLYAVHDEHPLLREAMAADSLGLPAHFTRQTELPFSVAGAVYFENQAQFHPLKFIKALAEQLHVYENTPVLSVHGHKLHTPQGTVTAKKIVFACHYPFIRFPGFYFMRMHQERSYVLALENAPEPDDMYIGIEEDTFSFRRHQQYLLLGGKGHRTGENTWGGNYESLWNAARDFYPGCRLHSYWSAQDCMTLDKIPYAGVFSPTKKDWFVTTGFQKWGMTSAMATAAALTDAICNQKNESVFTPRRFSSTAAKAMLQETGVAVKNLGKQFLTMPKRSAETLPQSEGGVVRCNGKKAAAYRQADGRLQTVPSKCSHMGCQLAWNPEEGTWDCPCHGSRYTSDGRKLDGPANRPLN
ncbi:MAG: FAD-dependent oxidoreductase [Oscillospiraceae bacterium]|nr:FAD-dependent oxidoreductase [Oscillospiraceae bacterium]